MQPLPDQAQHLMTRRECGPPRVTLMIFATVGFAESLMYISWSWDMTHLTCVCRLTLHCCWITYSEALDFVSFS